MEELTKMIKSIRRKWSIYWEILESLGVKGRGSKPTRKEAPNNNRGYNRYNHEAF